MPSSLPQKSQTYFPALTGVRAIAAWLVFFHHFNPFPLDSIGGRILSQFYVGVALFFVLSGLLICLRYSNRIDLNKKWAIRYFRNRVARIYPMYFLVTCISFASFSINSDYDASGTWHHFILSDKLLVFGLNITFLRGFFDYFKFSGVPAGWTLTVEECFYFIAPMLLLGLRGHAYKLLLYPILLVGFGALLVQFAPHRYGFFDSYTFLFTVTFFGRCLEFLAGMALALLLLKQASSIPSRVSYTWIGVIWIVAVIALMAFVYNPNLPASEMLPILIFLNNVALAPGLCALFYGLMQEQSSVQRILKTDLFDLLGKASYTFYLIHQGILSIVIDYHVTSNLLVKFLLTNLIAIFLFKLIEEPLHKLIAGHGKTKTLQVA